MSKEPVHSFPPYYHNLLEEKNVRILWHMYRQLIAYTSRVEGADASLKEIGDSITEQIVMLNNPTIWHYGLKLAFGTKDREEVLRISQANDFPVSRIAHVTTAGIILGFDRYQPMLAKYPPEPIGNATLAAITRFPSMIQDYAELTQRIAAVLGTARETGTLGIALESLDGEVLEAQPVFIDMLRVYGSYYLDQHPV